MTGKVSAENVFGQVLICLRMSRLDFLVTETPYAAYVTIRKRFMKTANAFENVNNVYNIDENLKLENLNLKEKLKDIQTKSALTVFENEELEIKMKH
jgi:hypothetical protein